ncbi:MAG: hypothetical protein WA160_10430 [Pseudobdellovibrio sp.]
MTIQKPFKNKKIIFNQNGQVLVEYLLLMVIAVACAAILTKGLVGRSDTNTGIIIKQWDKIIHILGNDLPDCAKQKDFASANCPP